MNMENDVPKNADKKTNITRIESQVLRNVKSDNKFQSAVEKGENEHDESSKFGEEVFVYEFDEEYAGEVEDLKKFMPLTISPHSLNTIQRRLTV